MAASRGNPNTKPKAFLSSSGHSFGWALLLCIHYSFLVMSAVTARRNQHLFSLVHHIIDATANDRRASATYCKAGAVCGVHEFLETSWSLGPVLLSIFPSPLPWEPEFVLVAWKHLIIPCVGAADFLGLMSSLVPSPQWLKAVSPWNPSASCLHCTSAFSLLSRTPSSAPDCSGTRWVLLIFIAKASAVGSSPGSLRRLSLWSINYALLRMCFHL